MAKNIVTIDIYMEPTTQARLANLCGPLDDNLKQIERRMGVEISHRDNLFQVVGRPEIAKPVSNMLRDLYIETQPVKGVMTDILPDTVHLALEQCRALQQNPDQNSYGKELYIKTRKGLIKPRNANQQEYVANILKHDITFGIGPAGTGKTYLAVACAIDALEHQKVRRILLTRPAVEAGEKLGFLPGDLSQKVDPYLRPLYDALFEMLGFEKVAHLIEKNVIEVAPLAYMRGRTFNDAFIILDESQNTTAEQMKMFLTRIGFNSKAVITGDITQIDLPHHVTSGLRQSIEVLGGITDISFNFFESGDIVRHQLVAQVVDAYQRFDTLQSRLKAENKAQRLSLDSSPSTQENS
ncbi:MAG: PhoH family protein [Psychrobium sp.]|nr:PhoH family protein [Psychrobium sp.]